MAFLRAFGSYVPTVVASNTEVAARCGCDPEWIKTVSGIEERRVASAEDTVAEMGVRAALDCLKRARVDASRIGLILFSSGSAEQRFPGAGAEAALKLGIAGVPVVDLPMASAGSLFGMALASQLATVYGEVLVIASEKMTPIVWREPVDRNTAILFGDGAGAVLVSRESGVAEVLHSVLHSNGEFAADLLLPIGGPFYMNGPVVILQASRKIPAAIQEALQRSGLAAAGVERYLMHQANSNLTVRVARSLGVACDNFYSNIARYGNTSSASMLIAAKEWSDEEGFSAGKHVVFAGFGAGFHWGALVARGV